MEYSITDEDIDKLCDRFKLGREEVEACLFGTRAIEVKQDDFDIFWTIYKRKGNKKQARMQWSKMSNRKRQIAIEHAKRYIASRELQYCKDAERYLRYEVYYDEIHTTGSTTNLADVIEYRDSLANALGL